MDNTDLISIWCEEFKTSFGELTLPKTVSLEPDSLVDIQPPPPTPEEACPAVSVLLIVLLYSVLFIACPCVLYILRIYNTHLELLVCVRAIYSLSLVHDCIYVYS